MTTLTRMRWLRYLTEHVVLINLIVFATGCSTLTKTQIKAVNQFALASNNFSAYPSKIMNGLTSVRVKRGVFYANSLADPKLHLQELDNIYKQQQIDIRELKKVDITFKIIDRYAQYLLLLSSDKYVTKVDKESGVLGPDLDSLVARYNLQSGVQRVPAGIGGAVSSIIVLAGKQYLRQKQAKLISEFVPKADTLIAVMTSNLLTFLTSTNIKELIENEEAGINSSYLSYLRQLRTVSRSVSTQDSSMVVANGKSPVENDQQYLELKSSLDGVKLLQAQTVSATKSLRKAHKRLAELVKAKRKLSNAVEEIQQLSGDIQEARFTISEFEKTKL